jgi:hypothetical protein
VLLYFTTDIALPFSTVAMTPSPDTRDLYVGEIPPFPGGTVVYYYVEARSSTSFFTATFAPARAERGASSYRVPLPRSEGSPIVINELMAANTRTLSNGPGSFDDWIELHNLSEETIDLSGMYLSDREDQPRRWAFPRGTFLEPREYLVVWADGEGDETPGLHTDFRLSAEGEVLTLVASDESGDRLLDSVRFGPQTRDLALGRHPDGIGGFRLLRPTPGRSNEAR